MGEILTIKFYLRFLFTIYDFTFELKFSFLILLVLALTVDLIFRPLIFNIFISVRLRRTIDPPPTLVWFLIL